MTRTSTLSTPAKATIAAGIVVALLTISAVVYSFASRPAAPDPAGAEGALPGTRTSTHVLDEVGPEAPTLVEFLDFECEACGAFYPVIEQLREEYAGEINFAIRYFPLPGHFNAMNAAIAVEAAAQQDALEPMYSKMFETQEQWGEQQTSEEARFRSYAEELGLDMVAYDSAVADPATRARVEEDYNDARALGASSTPTFFLEGEQLQLTQLTDLTDAIDRAIAD
ncbi:DsbA family protein [Microbacterium sp. A1-JK]|uniref:DsbA family protein n=1 Tax=Microbacterium sp. A1-JK TaxID=3177516 RepID=UPI00388AA152